MTSIVPCQPRQTRRPAQGSSPFSASLAPTASLDARGDSRRPAAQRRHSVSPNPEATGCDASASATTWLTATATDTEMARATATITATAAATVDRASDLSLSPAPQPAEAHGAAGSVAAGRNHAGAKRRGADGSAVGSSLASGNEAGAASRGANPPSAELLRRNRRVESYRDLVRPLALHYARRCAESCDDLIQVGMLGLIRAAELYRSETGTPFEAFARPHIRGAILHYLRDEAPSVRLPRRQAELQERLQRLEDRHGACLDPATSARLRRQLGIDDHHWSLLQRQRRLCRPVPLESELLEELAAPDDQEGREGAVDVCSLLAELEPRQRQVVRQVILDGCSYRRLAKQMQVSPMTVQRLLQRGLEHLRQQLDQRQLSSGRWEHRAGSELPAC